jgi:preprotein translocase subunit SecF
MTHDLVRFAAVVATVCLAVALLAWTGIEVSLDTPAGLLSLRIP